MNTPSPARALAENIIIYFVQIDDPRRGEFFTYVHALVKAELEKATAEGKAYKLSYWTTRIAEAKKEAVEQTWKEAREWHKAEQEHAVEKAYLDAAKIVLNYFWESPQFRGNGSAAVEKLAAKLREKAGQ